MVRIGGEHDRVVLSDWERKIFAVIQAEFHRTCQRSNLRQLGVFFFLTALFETVAVALLLLASQAESLAMIATAVVVVCLCPAFFAVVLAPRPVPATVPVRFWPSR